MLKVTLKITRDCAVVDNSINSPYNHTVNQKKIIIVAFVVLSGLLIFIIIDSHKKNNLQNETLSQNILYITQPVNSFSGTVDKIEGNTVSVSNRYSLPQTGPITITVIPNQPPIMPTPKTITVVYKIVVSGKTQITQPQSPINYLFKTIFPSQDPKLTLQDIKVGSYITVNSQVDLRTLKGIIFEATTINIPQKTSTLNGTILRVDENMLTIKAFPPTAMSAFANPAAMGTPQNALKEKEYTIAITSDTEISRYTHSVVNIAVGEAPPAPKPEKLSPSDLIKDMQITVYTAEDILANTSLTALRIEPIFVSSPSAQTQP